MEKKWINNCTNYTYIYMYIIGSSISKKIMIIKIPKWILVQFGLNELVNLYKSDVSIEDHGKLIAR